MVVHDDICPTIKITGPVSAVGDLKVTESSTSIKISWTAPFSLDVTGVDPDIWYSVLLYNVTDENNPTAILCTDCINITETHYTFTPDHPSPCHAYHFTVIPFNGAGKGESSHSITGYTLESKLPHSIIVSPIYIYLPLFFNDCRSQPICKFHWARH